MFSARQLEAKHVIRRPQDVQLVTTGIDHFEVAYAARYGPGTGYFSVMQRVAKPDDRFSDNFF